MFKVGDFVKVKRGEIGIVAWTENRCMDLKTEDGYIGIDLKTGSKVFLAPVKVEECTKTNLNELVKTLENEKKEIEERLYKSQINKKTYEEKCRENELLKQLLSIYISNVEYREEF